MTSPLGLQQPTLDVIAAAYAAVVLERQDAFEALAGGASWDADLAAARLQIGERTLRIALLGSASDADGSWLWAWDNPTFGPDHPATRPLRALVEVGREHDIPELVRPVVPLSSLSDPGDGPAMTIVTAASGLLGAGGYWPAPYDGGIAYLAVLDRALPAPTPDALALAELMQRAITAYPHDNRLTVETYLGVHGLSARVEASTVVAELGGREARFEFDATDRLTALEVSE
ncbi:hypothetical protein EK0264_01675 [Epidermidibacterium keratini]|uniref:Uncharacterized protein n=1 Tax=Epidermidibacterium keratini TaxID=1891644 RepID=A0A7L4YHZ5_9ACTN|nr:DUF6882 domain-containing protein [Epidermidibacterium keratini]QHB99124.1 hypothetical protein EK0264_01675 [Epidermidibacterium keratini]